MSRIDILHRKKTIKHKKNNNDNNNEKSKKKYMRKVGEDLVNHS